MDDGRLPVVLGDYVTANLANGGGTRQGWLVELTAEVAVLRGEVGVYRCLPGGLVRVVNAPDAQAH